MQQGALESLRYSGSAEGLTSEGMYTPGVLPRRGGTRMTFATDVSVHEWGASTTYSMSRGNDGRGESPQGYESVVIESRTGARAASARNQIGLDFRMRDFIR